MGLHFLGLFRIALPVSREAHGDAKARRPVGRLCDGARLRLRLDAVHRADPGRDPRGRGVRDRRWRRARGCSRSIRSGLAFRSCWRPLPIEPFAAFLARFRQHLAKVEQVMGASPGAHRHRLSHRLHLTGEFLAAGDVSRARQDRLTKKPAPTGAGFVRQTYCSLRNPCRPEPRRTCRPCSTCRTRSRPW